MKMFLGQYSPNITEGSRIALPKKLREQIESSEVVLSKGFEKCVLIYDKQNWITEAQTQVEDLGTGYKTGDLKRYLYSSATESSIDSQGRIVIPVSLRNYAGIKGKTSVIGVGDHIEVWDDGTWNRHVEKIAKELSA